MRQWLVSSYLCPNRGAGRPLVLCTPDGVHNHPLGPYASAYADYACTPGTDYTGASHASYIDNGAMIFGNYNEFPTNPLIMTGWHSRTSFKTVTDGTSKTFLAGHVTLLHANNVAAYNGDTNEGCRLGGKDQNGVDYTFKIDNEKQDGLGSEHVGVVPFVFCDGEVRSISINTSLKVLAALVTRAGGETVQVP
jgi:hypothetical protein